MSLFLILVCVALIGVVTYVVIMRIETYADAPAHAAMLSPSTPSSSCSGQTNRERAKKVYDGKDIDMDRDLQENYAWYANFEDMPLTIPRTVNALKFRIYTEEFVDSFVKVRVYHSAGSIKNNYSEFDTENDNSQNPYIFVFRVPLQANSTIYTMDIFGIKAFTSTSVDDVKTTVFKYPVYSGLIGQSPNGPIYNKATLQSEDLNFTTARKIYKLRMNIANQIANVQDTSYVLDLIINNDFMPTATKEVRGAALKKEFLLSFVGTQGVVIRNVTLQINGIFETEIHKLVPKAIMSSIQDDKYVLIFKSTFEIGDTIELTSSEQTSLPPSVDNRTEFKIQVQPQWRKWFRTFADATIQFDRSGTSYPLKDATIDNDMITFRIATTTRFRQNNNFFAINFPTILKSNLEVNYSSVFNIPGGMVVFRDFTIYINLSSIINFDQKESSESVSNKIASFRVTLNGDGLPTPWTTNEGRYTVKNGNIYAVVVVDRYIQLLKTIEMDIIPREPKFSQAKWSLTLFSNINYMGDQYQISSDDIGKNELSKSQKVKDTWYLPYTPFRTLSYKFVSDNQSHEVRFIKNNVITHIGTGWDHVHNVDVTGYIIAPAQPGWTLMMWQDDDFGGKIRRFESWQNGVIDRDLKIDKDLYIERELDTWYINFTPFGTSSIHFECRINTYELHFIKSNDPRRTESDQITYSKRGSGKDVIYGDPKVNSYRIVTVKDDK